MVLVKNIIKIVLILGAFFAIYIGACLIGAIVTDYETDEVEEIVIAGQSESVISKGDTINIITYNIGYCGLEKEQDFFMDGGKNSRGQSKEKVQENLESVVSLLNKVSPDFIMLQEVDRSGDRSYDVDQVDYIESNMGDNISHGYALNYNVKWVPLPITRPMGGAVSGLLSISDYKIDNARRFALPKNETFPNKYFELDRCILELEIPVDNGKKLYLINVHLSAFDKGGEVRKKQMDFLIKYLNEKKRNNDYIIMGGDWNHILNDKLSSNYDKLPSWIMDLPESFNVEEFTMYSPDSATVRDNEKPYEKGLTFESIIDGFYLSDNIKVNMIEAYDLGFTNSDHNPVRIEIVLN